LHLYIFKNTQYVYSGLDATIFTFIFSPYDMFRPQAVIIKCFAYAKTAILYKMYNKTFIYLYTCKWDVSYSIYLMYTQYLFAMINFTQFIIWQEDDIKMNFKSELVNKLPECGE
jgi:hypothetical protein